MSIASWYWVVKEKESKHAAVSTDSEVDVQKLNKQLKSAQVTRPVQFCTLKST